MVAATLQTLPLLTFIPLDDEFAQRAADLAADHSLRGADAVYAAVAQRNGTTLITLDDEHYQRAAAVIATRTPAEALAELSPPTQ